MKTPLSRRNALPGPPARLDSYSVGVLVAKLRRGMWTKAVRELEAVGESLSVWQIIAHLGREGRVGQQELAAAIATDPGGVSRTLDRLEEDGLVLRIRDASDRRRISVGLTEQGRARVEAVRPVMTRVMTETLAPLDDDELAQLAALLRKCVGG